MLQSSMSECCLLEDKGLNTKAQLYEEVEIKYNSVRLQRYKQQQLPQQ